MFGFWRQIYKLLFFIMGTCVLMTLHCLYLIAFVFTKPAPYPRFFVRVWYKFMLWLLGVRVIVHGKRPKIKQQQIFYVSNHISYLDVLVLGAYFPCFFVAKADIASWPVFGFLSKIGGTIFISRSRAVVQQQAQKLQTALQQGAHLCIFPEGTTSNGQQILPFKSSLLQPLYTLNNQQLILQPLCLAYTHVNGRKLEQQTQFDQVAYYGSHVFMPHFWQLLKLRRITAKITILPTQKLATYPDRKLLVADIQNAVEVALSA